MRRNSIIILKRNNLILLNLRDNKSWIDYPNYWGCIGGGIEEGESALESIKRELNEEISCDVRNIIEIGKIKIKDDPKCRDCENVVFLGKIDVNEKSIKLNEGRELRFFDLEELLRIKAPWKLKEFMVENKKTIFNY